REIELRGCACPVGIATGGRTRKSSDNAIRSDFANHTVERICYIDVAGAIDRYTLRKIKSRGGPRSVGTSGVIRRARKKLNRAILGGLADGVVTRIRNINVSCAVYRYTRGKIKSRGAADGSVSGKILEQVWLIVRLRLGRDASDRNQDDGEQRND